MRLFKSKESRKSIGPELAAGWIAGCILRMQRYWALQMGRCFDRLSPASKKVVLVSSCLLMVGYSTILVAESFSKGGKSFIMPAPISRPVVEAYKHIPAMGGTGTGLPSPFTRFHKYIDSLSLSAEGRKKRDSLLRQRPGLMDSIKKVESLYRQ